MAERMVQLGSSSRSFISAPEERRRSSRSFIGSAEGQRRSSRSFLTPVDEHGARWKPKHLSWDRVPALLLAAIFSTAMVMGSVLFLVWVRMAEMQAGYAVYQLQGEKVRLRQAKNALEVEIASLRRPDRLHGLAAKYDLYAPRAEQILHVSRDELQKIQARPSVASTTPRQAHNAVDEQGGAR